MLFSFFFCSWQTFHHAQPYMYNLKNLQSYFKAELTKKDQLWVILNNLWNKVEVHTAAVHECGCLTQSDGAFYAIWWKAVRKQSAYIFSSVVSYFLLVDFPPLCLSLHLSACHQNEHKHSYLRVARGNKANDHIPCVTVWDFPIWHRVEPRTCSCTHTHIFCFAQTPSTSSELQPYYMSSAGGQVH